MAKRNRIKASDREIAGHFLRLLARHKHEYVCLDACYDDDVAFLSELSKAIGLPSGFPWPSLQRRLQKVCRRLQAHGIIYGRVASSHAMYLGEPKVLKRYGFGDPGYAMRLAPDLYPHYKPMGDSSVELKIFLDRAFGWEDENERDNDEAT